MVQCTQAHNHKAEWFKQESLFPPKVENSQSGGTWDSWRGTDTLLQLDPKLDQTLYQQRELYSTSDNYDEKRSEGRANLQMSPLRYYHAGHTSKIW